MSAATDSKKQTIANLIGGNIVDDGDRVAVCIKGLVDGFPATMEAIYAGWPFGVVYTLETTVLTDQLQPQADGRITIYPRVGRGMASFFTKLFLFESSGLSVGDKGLEKIFNFSYEEREVAERFIHYPGIRELLIGLENVSKFSELVVRPGVGIYLAQPGCFDSLEFDVCRNTFQTLGAIGKVLFEAF